MTHALKLPQRVEYERGCVMAAEPTDEVVKIKPSLLPFAWKRLVALIVGNFGKVHRLSINERTCLEKGGLVDLEIDVLACSCSALVKSTISDRVNNAGTLMFQTRPIGLPSFPI